jgi:type III secretory pathway component EscU
LDELNKSHQTTVVKESVEEDGGQHMKQERRQFDRVKIEYDLDIP